MKKSERYQYAMLAVVACDKIEDSAKLEILETLMADKGLADFVENQKEEGMQA